MNNALALAAIVAALLSIAEQDYLNGRRLLGGLAVLFVVLAFVL
jgi:hypothetical protein